MIKQTALHFSLSELLMLRRAIRRIAAVSMFSWEEQQTAEEIDAKITAAINDNKRDSKS